MALRIPFQLTSHNRKIATLYKKWLRQIEGTSFQVDEYRYKCVLARCEFDAILNEKDIRKSKQMLLDKQAEYDKEFYLMEPIHFPDSPHGVAYQRTPELDDYLLDFWHPLEKAIYPKYFATREVRKQQYLEMWEKQHGPPPPMDDH